MKRILVLCFLAALSTACYADNFIYGNNATGGSPYIFKIDKTSGAIVQTYTGLSGNNGRGVVVVGTTMYYTAAYNSSIYSYNLATSTDNGSVFTVPGATGLSTIAYDGTNFYVGDYSGTNQVYKYTTTGAYIATLNLANCTGHCDGLEYFQQGGIGYLIENRDDGGYIYDVYNLDGSLKTAAFITSSGSSTGIAFDGTTFFTSNLYSPGLNEFDTSGTFIKTLNITGAPSGFSFLVEDLSADYATVLPPPSGATPEPSSLVLLGTGALGMIGAFRRKLKA